MLCALVLGAIALLLTRGTGDIEAMLWIGILALQCIPYTASILCQIAAYQPERSKTTPEGTPPADAPAAEGTA